MKKSDLKNGMITESRNGKRYIVINDRLISITEGGYNNLSDYNEDLTLKRATEDVEEICAKYDIMKVYGEVSHIDLYENKLLLWERTEVKEVTMAEIEEKFGCKVKIIKE